MSDNTTLDPGIGGDIISTEAILDDDGSVIAKVQLQKIMLGDHGKNNGTLSEANPMPVRDRTLEELLVRLIEEVQRGNDILEEGL